MEKYSKFVSEFLSLGDISPVTLVSIDQYCVRLRIAGGVLRETLLYSVSALTIKFDLELVVIAENDASLTIKLS